jgi:hypothetical protein
MARRHSPAAGNTHLGVDMAGNRCDALVIFGATGDVARLETFPELVRLVERECSTSPFHSGLIVVFSVSAALSVLAGLASLLRGKRRDSVS